MMTIATTASATTGVKNPYVGPRTFSYADRHLYFGREREARSLLARVVSARLLLFYAQSGAGKSSLINTRLIPQLREEEGFSVLPIGRVAGEILADAGTVDNIFVFNLVSTLDQGGADPAQLAHVTLSDFLDHLVTDDGLHWRYDPAMAVKADTLEATATMGAAPAPRFALVVDQFEEIVTTHPGRWQEREDFFCQLDAALLANPNLWVVLTLREDHVAALDPFGPLLFNRLRARFYMERMDVDAALEAVQEPAQVHGRPFAPGVAEALVKDLSRIKVLGQTAAQPGQYVEPVQLQVVCYQLWENVSERKTQIPDTDLDYADEIAEADLAAAGDVDRSLVQFYEQTLTAVLTEPNVRAAGVSERALRSWFDQELITETGIRSTVLRNETGDCTGSLPNAAVDALMQRYLLRTELRGGGAWIELVHDRFVEPIRRSNTAWWPQNLSTLQRQADLWSNQSLSHRDGFLLSGQALVQAEQSAAIQANELTAIEEDFLISCRAASSRAAKWTWMYRVIFALFILAVFFLFLTFYYVTKAGEETRRSQSVNLAADARRAIDTDDPSLALALAIESVESTWREDGYVTAEANSSLLKAIEAAPAWRRSLIGHSDQVLHATVSPDGEHILSSSADYSARIWDVGNGQELLRLKGHFGNVNQAVFSHNGHRIYTASADSTVREWDAETGQELRQFLEPDLVWSLSVSGDGRLVTGSNDHSVRVWDLTTGKILRVLEGHESIVWTAVFSPNDKRVLTASGDGTARIWDADSGQELVVLKVEEGAGLKSANYSPDGDRVVTAGTDHIVRLWDATSGEELGQLRGHSDIVNYAAFNSDGTLVVSVGEDRSVRIWDPLNSRELRRLQGHRAPVISGEFGWNDDRLITASADRTIRIWDARAQGGLQEFSDEGGGAIHSVAFNSDGSELVTAGQKGTVRVWDTQTGRSVRNLRGHFGPVNHVEFSSSDAEIVTAGNDGTARIWDAATGLQRLEVTAPKGILLMANLSPQADMLATAGSDGVVRLWNPRTGDEVAELFGHSGSVRSLDFSPDGRRLMSAGDDGTARLWDVDSQRLTAQFVANASLTNPFIDSAEFSPKDPYIVTAGYDGIVRIWHAENLQLILELDKDLEYQALPGTVHQAVFSRDGTKIAAGGSDGVMRIWNVADWQESLSFPGNEVPIRDLAFTPNGEYVATANWDQRTRLWPVDVEDRLELARSLIQRDSETSAARTICTGDVDPAFQPTYAAYGIFLGCPIGEAYTVETTSEQAFQGGRMFWRSDGKPVVIAFFRSSTDDRERNRGLWETNPERKWDGKNPDGIGLTPPKGLAEPVFGFGWLWRTYYDGPDGILGWAIGNEEYSKETRVQEFTQGFLLRSGASETYIMLYSEEFFVVRE